MVQLKIGGNEIPSHVNINISLLVFIEVLERSAGESIKAYTSKPLLNALVASKYFSVCLLQKHHPQFLFVSSWEERVASVQWEVVVQYNTSPQSIHEQPYAVVAVGANFSSLEEAFHDKRVLSNGGHWWQ